MLNLLIRNPVFFVPKLHPGNEAQIFLSSSPGSASLPETRQNLQNTHPQVPAWKRSAGLNVRHTAHATTNPPTVFRLTGGSLSCYSSIGGLVFIGVYGYSSKEGDFNENAFFA